MIYSAASLQEKALGQLSAEELAIGIEAVNGLVDLFGEDWFERDHPYQSALPVLEAIRVWSDWLLVRALPGATELRNRLRLESEGSARAELHVFACLLKGGHRVEIHPDIGISRRPDCRFETAAGWTPLEIACRAVSRASRDGFAAVTAVAEAARLAARGEHSIVALVRTLEPGEVDAACEWIRGLTTEDAELPGTAFFHRASWDTVAGAGPPGDPISARVPEPRLWALGAGPTGRGSASMPIADDALEWILNEKSKQLPPTGGGVICIDLSAAPFGYREWIGKAGARLQPSIHRRVSAVVLLQRRTPPDGSEAVGTVITNPHAYIGVSEAAHAALAGLFYPPKRLPT